MIKMETIEKQRPVWLLDVDGVLNVYGAPAPTRVWPGPDWEYRDLLHQFPFLAARPVLEFVARMHEEGLAEVRWHTTWQHAAHKIEDEFGLPEFAVQDAPEFGDRSYQIRGGKWFKLPAAERLIEEGRTVLWTDDDLAWQHPGTVKRINKLRATGRLLTIAPRYNEGLTPSRLLQIEKWLRAQRDPGHTEELTTPLRRSTRRRTRTHRKGESHDQVRSQAGGPQGWAAAVRAGAAGAAAGHADR